MNSHQRRIVRRAKWRARGGVVFDRVFAEWRSAALAREGVMSEGPVGDVISLAQEMKDSPLLAVVTLVAVPMFAARYVRRLMA